MKKFFKKSFTLLTGVMILVGMAFVPGKALAEGNVAQIGDVEYATLQGAIDAVVDSAEIMLIDNITSEDVVISANKDVILNLNDKTLHGTNAGGKATITVDYGATLTIQGDGEVVNNSVGNGASCVFNNGTTTIDGGTFYKDIGNKSYYNITNHGIMIVNGGTVKNETTYDNTSHASLVENGYYDYASTDPVLGYVDGTNHANPSLTINGGTFDGGLNTIKNDDGATLVINDANVKNNIQVAVFNVNEATINGGTFDVPTGLDKTPLYNRKYNDNLNKGELTINGGTFKGDYFIKPRLDNAGTIVVTNATVEVEKGIISGVITNGSLKISGGIFSNVIPAEYIADGYGIYKTADGKYGVKGAQDPDVALYIVNTKLEKTSNPGSLTGDAVFTGALEILGIDLATHEGYNQLSSARKPSVFVDLKSNRGSEDYTENTLKATFNDIIKTRHTTQEVVDKANEGTITSDLIDALNKLLARFKQDVNPKYTIHSGIPLVQKANALKPSLDKYDTLGETLKNQVLVGVQAARPASGFPRNQEVEKAFTGELAKLEYTFFYVTMTGAVNGKEVTVEATYPVTIDATLMSNGYLMDAEITSDIAIPANTKLNVKYYYKGEERLNKNYTVTTATKKLNGSELLGLAEKTKLNDGHKSAEEKFVITFDIPRQSSASTPLITVKSVIYDKDGNKLKELGQTEFNITIEKRSSGGGGGSSSSNPSNSEQEELVLPGETAEPGQSKDLEALKEEYREANKDNPEKLEQLEKALASAENSDVDEELKNAYIYAFLNGITTQPTIDEAELDRGVTRAEMAKMMVMFAMNVLGKEKVKTDNVQYPDVDSSLGDLADYIQLAYQLQIMGIDANGNPIENFDPNGEVTRAEFATVLSRILYGSEHNQEGADFYSKHLEALKEAGVLKNTTPTMKELRGWVMLMLYRSEIK